MTVPAGPSPHSARFAMSVTRFDHFTVLTKDVDATVAFYGSVLGFEIGPRPAIERPGVWLYCDGAPILHVFEISEVPSTSGAVDHIAFRGSGLAALVAKLEAGHIPFKLNRLPAGGPMAGDWQVFTTDPSGARVEINFPESETAPQLSR
jgi:catechol 2,3-dioxygenase-like lactoylglutathione lyase family enzyme